jgi:hypothetical protein
MPVEVDDAAGEINVCLQCGFLREQRSLIPVKIIWNHIFYKRAVHYSSVPAFVKCKVEGQAKMAKNNSAAVLRRYIDADRG